MIKLKRAYEPSAANDGARFLVERLWPRGIKKTDLELDTLVYSSHDAEHNNAVALKHYLETKLAHVGRKHTGAHG